MSEENSFECQRCGECCKVPAFFQICGEYKKAKRLFSELNIKFVEISDDWNLGPHIIPKTSFEQLEKVRTGKLDRPYCPFLSFNLDKKAECSIYKNRPGLCKIFICKKSK